MAKKNLENEKSKNILLTIIIILTIILVLFIVAGFLFLSSQADKKKLLNNPNIYNNIYIQGINVSNMSKDSAKATLEKLELNEKITLTYNDKQYVFNKTDFGVILDKESALNSAYNIGRIGSEQERIKKIKSLDKNGEQISISKNIQEDIAKSKLEEICKDINIEPKNATLEKSNGIFVVKDGNVGLEVDFDKTYENLLEGLMLEGDANISIIANETKPKYSAQELNKIQDKLGSFSTKYTNKGGSDVNRITNMKIASQRINGTILYPGEVFSTNKKFGATTKENGYKPAPTILNGKFIDEYGGGVCQVSSTLYNAVLYSELEVIERQNHSLKVGYLDYGYDATLAGDYIDFKFKNSTSYPIYIESYLTENEVICNIYGYEQRPDNRNIKFENALVEVIEPSPKIVKETDDLPEGEEKVEVKPLKGYKYKLYKLVYVDNKLTEKILVNNSYYKHRTEEVLIGTKKSEEAINIEEETISQYTTDSNITNSTELTTESTDESMEETTEQITEPIIEQSTEENIITEDIILE